jgi:hypothetical protein
MGAGSGRERRLPQYNHCRRVETLTSSSHSTGGVTGLVEILVFFQITKCTVPLLCHLALSTSTGSSALGISRSGTRQSIPGT